MGLSGENLTRIFRYGFTTKADGHGFGLHSCALAAGQMGGSLRAESAGLDGAPPSFWSCRSMEAEEAVAGDEQPKTNFTTEAQRHRERQQRTTKAEFTEETEATEDMGSAACGYREAIRPSTILVLSVSIGVHPWPNMRPSATG